MELLAVAGRPGGCSGRVRRGCGCRRAWQVADARGHRLVVIPGALLWAASFFWYLERVGSQPDFWGAWLPGQVLSGIGVGATLPILGAAALAVLPKGGGYATASAVVTSARQLGAVLGIALLVALVGNPGPADAEAALRQGWVLSAVCFLVVAVGAAFLGRTTAHPGGTAPLDAEAPAPCQRLRRLRSYPNTRPRRANRIYSVTCHCSAVSARRHRSS